MKKPEKATTTPNNSKLKLLTILAAMLVLLWGIDQLGTNQNTPTGYQTSEENKIPGFKLEKGWNYIAVIPAMEGQGRSELMTPPIAGNCEVEDLVWSGKAKIPKEYIGAILGIKVKDKCDYFPTAEKASYDTPQQIKLYKDHETQVGITEHYVGKPLRELIGSDCKDKISSIKTYTQDAASPADRMSGKADNAIKYFTYDSTGISLPEKYIGKAMGIETKEDCTLFKQTTETKQKPIELKIPGFRLKDSSLSYEDGYYYSTVAITPNMPGKKLKELAGTCNILPGTYWSEPEEKIPEDSEGLGMLIRIEKPCNFNTEETRTTSRTTPREIKAKKGERTSLIAITSNHINKPMTEIMGNDCQIKELRHYYKREDYDYEHYQSWDGGNSLLDAYKLKNLKFTEKNLGEVFSVITENDCTLFKQKTQEEKNYDIPGFMLEKGWNLIGITDDMTGKTTNDVKGQCDIKYAFAYDNAANPRLMATPTQAARITNTFTGNAMWLYTQNKCRYNPEAKEATWAGTKDKLKTGQKAATTITNKITNKKLQDIKIRGCNIEKAWVYLPSGVSEQREEEESYVGWQSLLPNDFLGDGYTGKGMVIKVGDCTEEAEGGKCTPTEEVCDGKDNNCNKKIDDEALCPEEQECIIGKCRTFDTSYKVQPVIFISANFDVDKEMRDYINSMFEEARQFYLKNTGATFTMLPTKIVNGEKSHGLYWCNTNEGGDTETTCNGGIFRSNMETELKSKGIPAQPGKTITWIAAFGGGAYAGESADYPIVGDAALYAAKDKSCERILDKYFPTDYEPNAKNKCQLWLNTRNQHGYGPGALAHELGHAFGAAHPDSYTGTTTKDWEKTVMGYHWNYPNTGLLEQDKKILAKSPYFNTKK